MPYKMSWTFTIVGNRSQKHVAVNPLQLSFESVPLRQNGFNGICIEWNGIRPLNHRRQVGLRVINRSKKDSPKTFNQSSFGLRAYEAKIYSCRHGSLRTSCCAPELTLNWLWKQCKKRCYHPMNVNGQRPQRIAGSQEKCHIHDWMRTDINCSARAKRVTTLSEGPSKSSQTLYSVDEFEVWRVVDQDVKVARKLKRKGRRM